MNKIHLINALLIIIVSSASADFNFGNMFKDKNETTKSMSEDAESAKEPSYNNTIQNNENKKQSALLENKLLENKKLQQKHFESIWNKIQDELLEGSELYAKKETAPKSTMFFGTDQSDINNDIDSLLNDMMNFLIEDDLLDYKEKIETLKEDIKKRQKKLATYREERIGAPTESLIHTTKDGYDKKIKNTLDEINIERNKIKIIQNNLKTNFSKIGVNLSQEQIEILLLRADGNDIIEVSLVMNILKQITNQILTLMKNSDENLVQAKRYYGMHLMSLALVTHIQQRYLDHVDNIYFKKLKKILNENQKLIQRTKQSISMEQNENRRTIYTTNLEAQNIMLKAALIYQEHLANSRQKMKEAQDEAKKNLLLAENTYATVALSSQMYNLIAKNELLFDKISQIQIPQIIPFQNDQIKQQYKILQVKILEDD